MIAEATAAEKPENEETTGQPQSESDVAAKAWEARSHELAETAWEHIAIKRDRHGEYSSTGGARWSNSPLTLEKLTEHFAGRRTIGCGVTSTEDLCWWVSLDLDNHVSEATTNQNLNYAIVVQKRLSEISVQSVIEDSDGKGGIHLWVFFADSVPAASVHRFAKWIARDFKEHGLDECECFPKSPTVQHTKKKCGNYVRLPGKHHKRNHWSRFWGDGEWLSSEDSVELLLNLPLNDPACLAHAPLEPPAKVREYTGPESDSTELVKSALPHIGSEDYDTWLRVGQALHNESEDYLDLWHEWSATSGKYDVDACEAKWKTFNRGSGVALGTVFHLAEANGWNRSTALAECDFSNLLGSDEEYLTTSAGDMECLLELRKKAVNEGVTPDELKQLTALDSDRLENAVKIDLPEDVFKNAPGFIGDYYRFLMDHAEKKLPEAFLAAGLAVLATVTGRDFRFRFKQWNTRSNLYLFVLAPSGAGKDFARKVNERVIRQVDNGLLQGMLGPNKFASDTAMLTSLVDYPKQLWQIDEFSKFLASLNSHKSGPHVVNMAEVLLELFSESDNPAYQAKAYAASQNKITINRPHSVIYGTSTPVGLWQSLSADQVKDGLMGRILTFEDHYQPRADEPETTAPEVDADGCVIIDQSAIADEPPAELTRPLTQWIDQASVAKQTIDIRILPDAYHRLSEHNKKIDRRRMDEHSMRAAIWSRAGEKTSKLSMLAAMARGKDIITLKDVEWAVLLTNGLTRRVVERIVGNVSENQQEANVKKLLSQIKERGAVSRRTLTRKTQWLNQRDRNSILTDLLTSGELVHATVARKTRPGEWFGVSYGEIFNAVKTTKSQA